MISRKKKMLVNSREWEFLVFPHCDDSKFLGFYTVHFLLTIVLLKLQDFFAILPWNPLHVHCNCTITCTYIAYIDDFTKYFVDESRILVFPNCTEWIILQTLPTYSTKCFYELIFAFYRRIFEWNRICASGCNFW